MSDRAVDIFLDAIEAGRLPPSEVFAEGAALDATASARSTLPPSLEELLRGTTAREPMLGGAGRSGVRLERVIIGGERYVLKHLHCDEDWVARATGDLSCRAVRLWRSGLFHQVPSCIEHTIVGCAGGIGRGGHGGALLMRDVREWLVPEGDAPLPLDQHLRFLDHMAALHARFWEWPDGLWLTPLAHRYLCFSGWMTGTEAALGGRQLVPGLVARGWARFPESAPRAADVVLPLTAEPWPLVEALEKSPATFLHGDWRAANLGSGPEGRTILLDWSLAGRGPACVELAWYLALNAARLPQPKEDAIAAYRRSLEFHGVEVTGWWDTQLALSLLGALVQFGWDKALHGEAADLAWWEERALEGAACLV